MTVGSRITVAVRLKIYDCSTLRIQKSNSLLIFTMLEFDQIDLLVTEKVTFPRSDLPSSIMYDSQANQVFSLQVKLQGEGGNSKGNMC